MVLVVDVDVVRSVVVGIDVAEVAGVLTEEVDPVEDNVVVVAAVLVLVLELVVVVVVVLVTVVARR